MLSQTDSQRLKLFAIIMIVLHHLAIWTPFLGSATDYLSNMGSCNVSLFLGLSGYGLAASWRKNQEMTKYWQKKIEKIFFPYFIVSLFWIIVFSKNTWPLEVMATNILGIHINQSLSLDFTMWFISFLYIWYIAFFFIMKTKQKMYIKISLLIIIGALFSSLCDVPTQWAAFFQVSRWAAYAFPTGVILFFSFERIKERQNIVEGGGTIPAYRSVKLNFFSHYI